MGEKVLNSKPQPANQKSPFSVYITFGLVASIAIIMNSFVGAGLAVWYPTLIKPEWTLDLSYTYLLQILLYVMTGVSIYRAYVNVEDLKAKWTGFFGMIAFVFINELTNVLFYNMQSVVIHFVGEIIVFGLGVFLFVHFLKHEKIAAIFFIPFLLWSLYNLPWSYELMKLNM